MIDQPKTRPGQMSSEELVMITSNKGLDLIKKFESLSKSAYLCPAGVWTIGYGHTAVVYPGQVVTKDEAEVLLKEDVKEAEEGVSELVKVPLNQNQFDALVSFTFNVGTDIDQDAKAEGLGDSTLLRKLNSLDYQGAAAEFPKWNRAGGRILKGLTRRRAAEQALFLSTEV
jgi:lysozyme